MRGPFSRVGLVLMMVMSFVAASGHHVVAGDSTLLVTMDGFEALPRTDGSTVVFQVQHDDSPLEFDYADVYGISLDGGEVFPIATGAGEQALADISDGVVVWYELEPGMSSRIFGKRLTTGEEFVVAEEADAGQHSPTISGDWVVWVRGDTQGESIMARNIMTMTDAITVASFPSERGIGIQVQVDNGIVVWTETSQVRTAPGRMEYRWRMLTMRIGEIEPALIAEGVAVYDYFESPNGHTVTLMEVEGIELGTWVLANGVVAAIQQILPSSSRVVTVDLETGVTTTVATYPAIFPDDGPIIDPLSLATDGRYVFWVVNDAQHSASVPRSDLWTHDLKTDSTFLAIADDDAPFPGNHYWQLFVSDGVLVWQRNDDDPDGDKSFVVEVHASPIADLLPASRRPVPVVPSLDPAYFTETGHNLGRGFKVFWEQNGELPVFGYPLTEEFTERETGTGKDVIVQYVERQRFEWHPENAGTPYEVQLGRLGAIDAERRGLWESLALFGYPISEAFVDTESGLTIQYFERAVFEHHPDNTGTLYEVLLVRLGAQELVERDW